MTLFQTVRQILRIEVVPSLVRLIDGTISLLGRIRQLDCIFFINVRPVLVTIIIRRWFLRVVHHLEVVITCCSLHLCSYVLIQDDRWAWPIQQRLFFFYDSCDKRRMAEVSHDGVLNACPCQILNLFLHWLTVIGSSCTFLAAVGYLNIRTSDDGLSFANICTAAIG